MFQQKIPSPSPNAPTELGKPLTPDVQLTRVRFSPCGTVLAAAAFDGTVRRWDVAGKDPKALPPLPGHDGWVTALAFLADKKRLVSADSWGKLLCRDYAGASPKASWQVPKAHDGWLRAVAVSPSGELVATAGRDGFVRLWSAADGAKRGEFAAGADTFSLAFHPGGKSLAAGDVFGVVRQFDLPAGKPVRTLEAKELYRLDRIQDVGGVRVLLFSADGATLFAAGSQPKTGGFVQGVPLVLGLDWATGKPVSRWKGASDAEGFVHDLCRHLSGYLVGVTSGQPGNGRLFCWKPGDASAFFLTPKMANCHSVDLHPDGVRLAVSATNANSSGNGRVKSKDGTYPGNASPIHLWQLPKRPA
jgi:hypothetical protein